MLKNLLEEDKYEELKKSDNNIYKALEIVTRLFENDLDKNGMPYMLHIAYVYRHVSSMNEKVIAILHDVIEEKDVTSEDLLDIGFPKNIVDGVVFLTRVRPMEYKDYIDKLIEVGSIEALHVKLADLENSMNISRIKKPTMKDYERVEKRYRPAHEKILNRLKEIEK